MQQKYKRTKIFEKEEIKSLTETITATTLIRNNAIAVFYNRCVFPGQRD